MMRERLYTFAWLLMLSGVIGPFWPFRPFRWRGPVEERLLLGLGLFVLGLVLAIACRPKR